MLNLQGRRKMIDERGSDVERNGVISEDEIVERMTRVLRSYLCRSGLFEAEEADKYIITKATYQKCTKVGEDDKLGNVFCEKNGEIFQGMTDVLRAKDNQYKEYFVGGVKIVKEELDWSICCSLRPPGCRLC